jgi:hypothetical protein
MGRRPAWTAEQIRALGAATNLATAAAILGIGRSQAYRLVAADQFPAPVIRAGTRVIVPVAGLLRLLLVDDADPTAPGTARLDPGGEASVDATTTRPADSAHRGRRIEHPQGEIR